jgi:adenylosuccinate lyase
MACVRRGGDRQAVHEIIRKNSHEAAKQVKELGRPNDLLERLVKEPAMAGIDLNALVNPQRFVGRAPQQVQQFISQIVEPIRARYQPYLSQTIKLRV